MKHSSRTFVTLGEKTLFFPFIQVGQETAARDGLMKMKQVYEANPALGDPMSIQGQLTENGHRLDKLRAELKKYQVWYKNLFLFFVVSQFVSDVH